MDAKLKEEKRKHRSLKKQIESLNDKLKTLQISLKTKEAQYSGRLDGGNEIKTQERLQKELRDATQEFQSTEEHIKQLTELLSAVNPIMSQEINDYGKMRFQFNSALYQYTEQLKVTCRFLFNVACLFIYFVLFGFWSFVVYVCLCGTKTMA